MKQTLNRTLNRTLCTVLAATAPRLAKKGIAAWSLQRSHADKTVLSAIGR